MTYTNTVSKPSSIPTSNESTQIIQKLQQANMINITTIQKLQNQLTVVTYERNAFRSISERVSHAFSRQQNELRENKISEENKSANPHEASVEQIKLRNENMALNDKLKECQEKKDQLEIKLQKLEQSHNKVDGENTELGSSLKLSNIIVDSSQERKSNHTLINAHIDDAQEYYKPQLKNLAKPRCTRKEAQIFAKDETAAVTFENTNVSEALALLQEEKKILNRSIRMIREREERLSFSSIHSQNEEDKVKIEELQRTNDRLARDLSEESKALQAVHEALQFLNLNQHKIKEPARLGQKCNRLRRGRDNRGHISVKCSPTQRPSFRSKSPFSKRVAGNDQIENDLKESEQRVKQLRKRLFGTRK